jgi:hypothetical protein
MGIRNRIRRAGLLLLALLGPACAGSAALSRSIPRDTPAAATLATWERAGGEAEDGEHVFVYELYVNPARPGLTVTASASTGGGSRPAESGGRRHRSWSEPRGRHARPRLLREGLAAGGGRSGSGAGPAAPAPGTANTARRHHRPRAPSTAPASPAARSGDNARSQEPEAAEKGGHYNRERSGLSRGAAGVWVPQHPPASMRPGQRRGCGGTQTRVPPSLIGAGDVGSGPPRPAKVRRSPWTRPAGVRARDRSGCGR